MNRQQIGWKERGLIFMENKPLTIQGDGSAHRKFIYVEDIALGNVAALQDSAKNQVINFNLCFF